MANILAKVAAIRTAIFGKDVRESIASGIEAINDEVESTTGRQNVIDSQEQSRINNENTRINNENTRKANETSRQSAESTRQTTFNASEVTRQNTFDANELTRTNTSNSNFITNDNIRQTTFNTNETARQSSFNSKETIRQNTFDANEVTRSAALNNHINNLDIHVTADDKNNWNRIDALVKLVDMLYATTAVTDENLVGITDENGTPWTI